MQEEENRREKNLPTSSIWGSGSVVEVNKESLLTNVGRDTLDLEGLEAGPVH